MIKVIFCYDANLHLKICAQCSINGQRHHGAVFSQHSSAQYNVPPSPQGIRHVDHFGFICRECSGGGSGGFHFVCYVFQCTNEALVRGRHCPLQTLWAISILLSLPGWSKLESLADRAVFAVIIHSWLIPFCYASERLIFILNFNILERYACFHPLL